MIERHKERQKPLGQRVGLRFTKRTREASGESRLQGTTSCSWALSRPSSSVRAKQTFEKDFPGPLDDLAKSSGKKGIRAMPKSGRAKFLLLSFTFSHSL